MNEGTLLACTFRDWSPVIGDPTIWGWITVLIYAFSAVVAASVATVAPFPRHTMGRERFFWICLTIGLVSKATQKC